MYSEIYPTLKRQSGFDNFEILVETLDKYFPSLFNLEALEAQAKKGIKKGSYVEFFERCLAHMGALYTPDEIIAEIYTLLLQNNEIRDSFLEKMLFVPPVDDHASSQLAFIEKMATGELKIAEPVTFLDMLRLSHNLHTRARKKQSELLPVSVLNLNSIPVEKADELKDQNSALLVNFNRDARGIAKWGVVDLRNKANPRVYCETPLLEAEKKELEDKLQFQFEEVSAGKADSLASTGYTAIAWLDQNITKSWNFDTTADFNALFKDYVFAQFRGDFNGIAYASSEGEFNNYVTEFVRHVRRYNHSLPETIDGYVFIRLAYFAMLGKIKNEAIPLNDLSRVITVIGRDSFTAMDFEDCTAASFRSAIPRFAHTLKAFGVLKEIDEKVTLTVPGKIATNLLNEQHESSCRTTNTNPIHIEYASRNHNLGDSSDEEDMAATMVLTLFRAHAKKREITINLPRQFQLNQEECRFIVDGMQDNAYITEFTINDDNVSLKNLKESILPVLARNRWLAESGYLPPMVDNYWHRAAKYWLLHLSQQTTLLEDKHEHGIFKRCVSEMGIKGLNALLHLLNDEAQREFIEGIFGKNKPAFYAACPVSDVNNYLDMLLHHLRHKAPFPFAEMGVAYQPNSNEKYIELINHINQSEQFERVVLTDCLRNTDTFRAFLRELTRAADQHKWVGLIVIPELENKDAVTETHRHLRVLYDNLNNVILRNRHHQHSQLTVAKITAVSNFNDEAPPPKEEGRIDRYETDNISIADAFKNIDPDKKWPLKRGGVVQLQLQQQQEIQQTRQIQQEQQKVHMQVLEEAIAGERVTYDNIDRLLGDFYQKFAAENYTDEKNAPLRDKETLLQGFFHTWINANPLVNASHVIRSMTLDAAKMLIRYQGRFTSGVSLDNLPKGFYTQRAKDGSLILSFNPEIGFINGSNPFTVNLTIKTPVAEAWEGDFRLLDDSYIHETPELDAKHFRYLALFAGLQPHKDYQADFTAFRKKKDSILEDMNFSEKEKVKAHWLVFLQAWKYEGREGVRKFLEMPLKDLVLTPDEAKQLLFKDLPVDVKAWISTVHLTSEQLKAIGQVYYRHGKEVMTLLLRKFRQIDCQLGDEFFVRFNNTVLTHSANYDCFISERFFEAMDDMIARLRSPRASGNRKAWLAISTHHMNTVQWENIETLWRAFEYFIAEITELGLDLQGDEFDEITPENMLVCLDRILETLKRIPGQAEKSLFLRKLHKLQLTQGGVHYAIQHEGFKYFDANLKLKDFSQGQPTYSPNLTRLYHWSEGESKLNILRTLASRSQFSHQDYQFLAKKLSAADVNAKNKLILLLFTQYDACNVPSVLKDNIENIHPDLLDVLARHLHKVVFTEGNSNVQVSLEALMALAINMQENTETAKKVGRLLSQYSQGTFLEAVSILWQTRRFERDFDKLITLFEKKVVKSDDCPEGLFQDGYKLAVLFGKEDPRHLKDFHDLVKNVSPIVKNELRLLINQLLSIDYEISQLENLKPLGNWSNLLACIGQMQANRANTAHYRMEFIGKLTRKGLQFKYSKSGDFRPLKDTPEDRPETLGFFVDHQARLWQFMQDHIAVPSNGDAKEALQPIMQFFKRLQMNRTYLNEIEPLLAILEKTEKGKLWTASYFYDLLKTLQPKDQQASFPIPLVKVVINDEALGAKPIDDVEKDFPPVLVAPLKAILKNTVFNKEQQSVLCELALKEYGFNKNNVLLGKIISLLKPENRALSRDYALRILATSKNMTELEKRVDKTKCLLEHEHNQAVVNANWTNTTALWLKALANRELVNELFTRIENDVRDNDTRALILHIIAWSSLTPGLRDTATFEHELDKKAPKLVELLTGMTPGDLESLANCYPHQPSPGADDIVRLINKHKNGMPWAVCLDEYQRNPHTEPRMDYKKMAKTREADLQRMLAETRVTRGENKEAMTTEQAARLSLVFAELKQLQAGEAFIPGFSIPIDRMRREDLAKAFKTLSNQAQNEPDNDRLRAQIWAVLFQGLSHTTRKYPHLAQQFALIANDICVDAHTRVLQLATGEGKSHFVALRAVKHAGMGKVVDICTAKRTLAQRDLEDYQAFCNFFEITSSYIHPLSHPKSYTDTQVHYSTAGDLSLFLDEQSFHGQPIPIEKNNRVGLFDEFDFIRFEEGRKTEYNYARPTGRTPKQMNWFYQAINEFYQRNRIYLTGRNANEIDVRILTFLAQELQNTAGEDEEKQGLVNSLLRDPLQLVRWLQSAQEAHDLTFGIGFTVREQNIKVGDTSYPMREIIPLTSDNQKVDGSTFSAGVQQLLAVLLNSEARRKNEAQNYHIHPESNIISSQVVSQRMKQLWGHWEGFSGTISASQAKTLHEQQGTEVLHVSTNQSDLRAWHNPDFFKEPNQRLQALIAKIRICLDQKKSMLFSCKNDAQVLLLKEQLKSILTPAEYTNFIFYTNEDEMSAEDVLSQKEEMEAWHGGKKRQAIGLIASGFGRGDNVGVEAVFLFDVNDVNDLLQKGGRTARNGEEGEVFQFYLINELQAEEQRLIDEIGHIPGANEGIEEILAQVEGDNDNEKTFERVMLLREYVFSIQNAANQGYHEGLAQLSSWGMELVSQFADPTHAAEFVISMTFAIKTLDKRWIDITSNPESTSEQKIRQIEECIEEQAQSLAEKCADILKNMMSEIAPFALQPYPAVKVEMVLEKKAPATPKTIDMAAVCTRLATLPTSAKDESSIKVIPALLQELSEKEVEFNEFSRKIIDCKSLQEFYKKLMVTMEKIRKPESGFNALRGSIIREFTPATLMEGISPPVADAVLSMLQDINAPVVEEIIKQLSKPGTLSNEMRIKGVMPLLAYLTKFTNDQQAQWGMEYTRHIDTFINSAPEDLTVMFSGSPMSYKHVNSLWRLAKAIASENNQGAIFTRLQEAVIDAPEQRLRMLTVAEVLASSLNEAEIPQFVGDFSRVMAQFSEGNNWDVFVNLVKKTQQWWNKDGQNGNKKALVELWQRLAVNAERLSALGDTFSLSFASSGKSWFEFLSTFMRMPAKFMVAEQKVFHHILTAISRFDAPKSEKQQIVDELIMGLQQRHDMVPANYFFDLLNLIAPQIELLHELLSVELPVSESATRAILTFFKANDFYQQMSAEERGQCLASLRRVLTPALEGSVGAQLTRYKIFLDRFKDEREGNSDALSLFTVAKWYLDFVYQHPSAVVDLDTLVERCHEFKVEDIIKEFDAHSFTSKECARLLSLAVIDRLTGVEFSHSCQKMTSFKTLLTKIHSIGRQEKERLYDELFNLSPDKFRIIIELISVYHAKIKANPALLMLVIEFAHSKDVDKTLLISLMSQLLSVAGTVSCTDERINGLRHGIDALLKSGMTKEGISERCKQLVNFEGFLTGIERFDETVKNTIRSQVLKLPLPVRLLLLDAIDEYRAEITANALLLQVMIEFAETPNAPLLFIYEQMAAASCSSERMYNLQEVMSSLIGESDSEQEFFTNCDEFINFDALLIKENFDETAQSTIRNNVLELPLPVRSILLVAAHRYREEISANPPLLNVMIYFAENHGEATLEFICNQLASAVGKIHCTPERMHNLQCGIERLLEESKSAPEFYNTCQGFINFNKLLNQMETLDEKAKNSRHQEMMQLEGDKFSTLVCIAAKWEKEIQANPILLIALINFGKRRISTECVTLLSAILVQAVGKKPCTVMRVLHLKTGVDRLVDEDPAILIQLLELMRKNPERIEELLFDNVAEYLQNSVREGERNRVMGVIDWFYKCAKKQPGSPQTMFDLDNKDFQEMFDFANFSEDRRNQRIIWMHLLNSEAFLTTEKRDGVQDNHSYQWDLQHNTQLLQAGFNCYIERIKEVLNSKSPCDVSHNRDLSISQQHGLLQLSQELELIGKPVLGLLYTEENVSQMKTSLNKLMGNYKASWFKTTERNTALDNLHAIINSEGISRYQEVITAIQNARINAMRSDRLLNETRFLKLNRGGSSRYLNTLNQMEDMVLRHWVQDVNALQHFQSYQETAKAEFLGVVLELREALERNEVENAQPFKERTGMKKITNFFLTEKTLTKHNELTASLYRFVFLFNDEHEAPDFTKGDLEELLDQLRDNFSLLPGDLKTLATEVLSRGEALATHVELAENHSARNILAG
ncbi:MAG: hypothetical protein Q8M03_03095 [Legionella sp.]|nr:hypothetical protein [Legionella sp.]